MFSFHWQKDNKTVMQEVSMDAEPGDVIGIRVLCKKGGSKEIQYIVEDNVKEEVLEEQTETETQDEVTGQEVDSEDIYPHRGYLVRNGRRRLYSP